MSEEMSRQISAETLRETLDGIPRKVYWEIFGKNPGKLFS